MHQRKMLEEVKEIAGCHQGTKKCEIDYKQKWTSAFEDSKSVTSRCSLCLYNGPKENDKAINKNIMGQNILKFPSPIVVFIFLKYDIWDNIWYTISA